MPGLALGKVGKAEYMGLPVHVIKYIHGIVLASVLLRSIFPPVKDPELAAEILKLRPPYVFAVVGNIRASAGSVIHDPGLPLHMEYTMFFPEGNEPLHKFKDVPVGLQKPPVQPGDPVILAVRVIISLLGIPKFVARQQKRRSLA